MAISYIGSITGTTSATIPTHQAGDLLVAFAYRDGNQTAPTVPSPWVTIGSASGSNSNASVIAYIVATGAGTASGTWTNATSLVIHVYRGTLGAAPIGGNGDTNGVSTTVTYPTLSMSRADGTSWVAGFAGHRSVDTTLESAPSGMTNRSTTVDATDEAAGHDTNGAVSSWANTNVAVGGSSSGWRARTIELLAKRALTLAVTVASFALTANSANVVKKYTLAVASANCVLTANNTGLKIDRKILLTTAAYTSTTPSVTITKAAALTHYSIQPVTAAFVFTGNNIGLLSGKKITAAVSNAVFTGNNTGLIAARKLAVANTAYLLTNNAADVLYGKRLLVSTASFSFTGNAITFYIGKRISLSPAAVIAAGNDVNLLLGRVMAAEASVYSYSANETGILTGRKVVVTSAAYTLTGNETAIYAGKLLAASPAAFNVITNNASIIIHRRITIESAAYNFSFYNVLITQIGSYAIAVDTLQITATPTDAHVKCSRLITVRLPIHQLLAPSGKNAALIVARQITAAPSAVLVTFYDAAMIKSIPAVITEFVYRKSFITIQFISNSTAIAETKKSSIVTAADKGESIITASITRKSIIV